ncbi:hypothetical protein BDR22DRAFT_895435 [Usnea florida]
MRFNHTTLIQNSPLKNPEPATAANERPVTLPHTLPNPEAAEALETTSSRLSAIALYLKTEAGKRVPNASLWDPSDGVRSTVERRLVALVGGHALLPPLPAACPASYDELGAPPIRFSSARLTVALLNPQGNFGKYYCGLNTHPDMGGQIVYVAELAKAMARRGVDVVIAARRYKDARFSEFDRHSDVLFQGRDAAATILRMSGSEDSDFRRKEDLWPLLDEWARQLATHWAVNGGAPHALSSHYGDGGFAATRLEFYTGIPHATFTAHSLGGQKADAYILDGRENALLGAGPHSLNMRQRLAAERASMRSARKIVVSTGMERTEQYAHPLYVGAVDWQRDGENKFVTIAPGVDPDVFGPNATSDDDSETTIELDKAIARDIRPERRHLHYVVLAGRLDPKKNHARVVQAFAETAQLRSQANLLLLLKGGPTAFETPQEAFEEGCNERAVAEQIGQLIGQHQLDGEVAVPGFENTQQQLACVCRHLGQMKKGVLVLASLFEPFGLMPLEGVLAGVAVLVGNWGGFTESLREQLPEGGTKDYAVFVDPYDTRSIAAGLLRLTGSSDTWDMFQKLGSQRVLENFTWDATAGHYIEAIESVLKRDRT